MMSRWIAAFACALTLALAMPFGNQAAADGYVRHGYGHVRCIAPASRWSFTSQPTNWVCKASEKCCYDYLARKGTCIDAANRCF
jgi:hypothetical protein